MNLSIYVEATYQIAEWAMLKVSLARMLSQESRIRARLGHHGAITEFAHRQFVPVLAPIFALFDRMRRKRNDAFYDISKIAEIAKSSR
jgi:hypothetical protein